MPAVRKKLLDGIDQYSAYYSVICVFGSVVGCVVVPLITQVSHSPAELGGKLGTRSRLVTSPYKYGQRPR